MEEDIYGFRVDYEADSGKSFLVLTENGQGKPDLIEFQVEMIAKNKIPGVAGLTIREKDLETRFCYDISGLISLSNFFRRQKVSKADFIKILQNITGTLTGCKKFLLNDNCFVISEKLIFINPESLEVFLIYIPCRSTADIVDLFKSFVTNLVIKTANIETDDNFVQKLLGLMKEEHQCISEFNTAIGRSEGKMTSDGSTLNGPGARRESAIPAISEAPQAPETAPLAESKKAVSYVPAILMLLTILSAVAVIVSKVLADLNLASVRPGSSWGIGAAVSVSCLVAGSGIYLGLKKRASETIEAKPLPTESNSNQRELVENIEDVGSNSVNLSNIDETVILNTWQQPVLVGNEEEDRIIISKAEFVIGRNLDTCDHAIRDKSIGRAHARIQNENGRFYIFDLDSKNGTFINGDRLVSNKQYELKPNDRVSLANLQFHFKIE